VALDAATENRIKAIESIINNIQITISKFPTKSQMQSLLNVRQAEINTLNNEVATLRAMVEALS